MTYKHIVKNLTQENMLANDLISKNFREKEDLLKSLIAIRNIGKCEE